MSMYTCSLCHVASLMQTEVLMKVIDISFIHTNSKLLLVERYNIGSPN